MSSEVLLHIFFIVNIPIHHQGGTTRYTDKDGWNPQKCFHSRVCESDFSFPFIFVIGNNTIMELIFLIWYDELQQFSQKDVYWKDI